MTSYFSSEFFSGFGQHLFSKFILAIDFVPSILLSREGVPFLYQACETFLQCFISNKSFFRWAGDINNSNATNGKLWFSFKNYLADTFFMKQDKYETHKMSTLIYPMCLLKCPQTTV